MARGAPRHRGRAPSPSGCARQHVRHGRHGPAVPGITGHHALHEPVSLHQGTAAGAVSQVSSRAGKRFHAGRAGSTSSGGRRRARRSGCDSDGRHERQVPALPADSSPVQAISSASPNARGAGHSPRGTIRPPGTTSTSSSESPAATLESGASASPDRGPPVRGDPRRRGWESGGSRMCSSRDRGGPLRDRRPRPMTMAAPVLGAPRGEGPAAPWRSR